MKRRKSAKTKSARARPVGKRGTPGSRARRAAFKRENSDFIDALMAAGAQALGLTIDPAWRDGVKFHLRLVLAHAARVDQFPLPDDAEPAPVFHA